MVRYYIKFICAVANLIRNHCNGDFIVGKVAMVLETVIFKGDIKNLLI